MLKAAVEAERAERDQDADCVRIDAAIALAEQDIVALEDRQLAPDEIRNNIIKRANKAKATERWMIEKLIREEGDERVLRENCPVANSKPLFA